MPEEKYSWYPFRVAYRNEKKIKNILDIAGIENYIPFHEEEYYWKGSLRNVETPIFPGIGFARVDDFDLEMLKMMEEVSLFVNAENNFVTYSDEELQQIKETPAYFTEELFKP